jgi:hypothetical protein
VSTRLRKRETNTSNNPAPKKRAKGKQADKPSPKKQKMAPVLVQGGDTSSSEDDEPLIDRYSRKKLQQGENKRSPSRQGPVPSSQTKGPSEVDTINQPLSTLPQSSDYAQHNPSGQAPQPTQNKGKKAVETDSNHGTRPPTGNMQSALPFMFTQSAR